jgi:hypothetical protein
VSVSYCRRCSGRGWICSRCGTWHHGPRKQCHGCRSRAAPDRCPGVVAGTLIRGAYAGDGLDKPCLATESKEHFTSFVTCDCCGVNAHGFGRIYPSSWKHVARSTDPKATLLVICTECHDEYQRCMVVAVEQLFINREGMNPPHDWRPLSAPQFKPDRATLLTRQAELIAEKFRTCTEAGCTNAREMRSTFCAVHAPAFSNRPIARRTETPMQRDMNGAPVTVMENINLDGMTALATQLGQAAQVMGDAAAGAAQHIADTVLRAFGQNIVVASTPDGSDQLIVVDEAEAEAQLQEDLAEDEAHILDGINARD